MKRKRLQLFVELNEKKNRYSIQSNVKVSSIIRVEDAKKKKRNYYRFHWLNLNTVEIVDLMLPKKKIISSSSSS